jgi:propanol-preferring alcohol dehydrogenase
MGEIPETMMAYRIVAWQQPARLVEVDVPTPTAGQVLVKVAGTGLCHSDLMMQDMSEDVASSLGWRVPFTLGHEIGGHVAATGSGVTCVRLGDPVALLAAPSCGDCWFCLRGQENNCVNSVGGRGAGRDGGLAQYVLVDHERAIVPLDRLDPATAGPLTDAGATSYHAVKRVLPRLDAGSTAVVIGAGGLGVFAIQFLRVLSDAQVVVVDTNESRLQLATELGAHHTLVGVDDTTSDQLRVLGDGLGVSAVLDFAGFDSTIAVGMASVRPGGAFGLVGHHGGGGLAGPLAENLPRDAEIFTFSGPTISDTRDVIGLAENGLIRNEVELFDLNDVEHAYDKLRSGGLRGRAVIRFSDNDGR